MNGSTSCKIVIGALLFFIFSAVSIAAESFKIEDYIPQKFVDLEWRLDGNLRFNGSNTDSESVPLEEDQGQTNRSESNRDGTDFRAGTDFIYRYETVPKFLRYSASFDMTYSNGGSNGQSYREDTLGGSYQSSSTQDAHSYRLAARETIEAGTYVAGDQFISALWSGSAIYNTTPEQKVHSLNIDEYESGGFHYYRYNNRDREYDMTSRKYYGRLELGTGHGRVYEGLYAATAAYMVDELKKAGALTGVPDRDQMIGLCELIYEYKLKHAVDKRLLKIEALGEIYEYLNSIGATDDGHAGYLAVQDVWDFFPRDSRRFGTILSGGVGWEYNYARTGRDFADSETRLYWNYDLNNPVVVDTTADVTYRSSTTDVDRIQSDNEFLTGRFEHYRPVSIKWQWDAIGQVAYFLHAEHISNSPLVRTIRRKSVGLPSIDRKEIEDYYQIQAASTLSYIYSSRTTGQVYAGISYDNYSDRAWDSSERWSSRNRLTLALDVEMTYRVSIPTTLSANVSYDYRKDENKTISISDYSSSNWTVATYISHYLF